MLGKIWNSKAMNTFGEVGYETLQCGKHIMGTTLKSVGFATKVVLEGVANSMNNTEEENTVSSNQTYDYWMTLTYEEQKEYFERNEYLNMYIDDDFYPNDRELTAKHVQYIADNLNREFINKYDRY